MDVWIYGYTYIYTYIYIYTLFLSAGSPLRGNPFSGFWLLLNSSLCLQGLPFGGIHVQDLIFVKSSFCLQGLPFRGIHLQDSDFGVGISLLFSLGDTTVRG
jgi:hypothetical protein